MVYEIWRSDSGESVHFVSSGFWRHVNTWMDTSVSLEHTSSVFFVSVQYSKYFKYSLNQEIYFIKIPLLYSFRMFSCTKTIIVACYIKWQHLISSIQLRYSPTLTLDSSFEISYSHTIKTHGRTPLDEWSARRRGLYLHRTTLYKHKRQTSMPSAGFEPAIPATKRP
jgi:hypothetical protein